jgi:hypothetical protein
VLHQLYFLVLGVGQPEIVIKDVQQEEPSTSVLIHDETESVKSEM